MDLRKYPSNPKDAKNLGFANDFGNLCASKQRVIENMWMSLAFQLVHPTPIFPRIALLENLTGTTQICFTCKEVP
jgi:hypothetical protein